MVPTPTASTAVLEEITTDPAPDVRFYQLSLDQAARSGTRTVAVFSTPAFCRTATCGPMLDQVKDLAPSYPDLNFVHVEITSYMWRSMPASTNPTSSRTETISLPR